MPGDIQDVADIITEENSLRNNVVEGKAALWDSNKDEVPVDEVCDLGRWRGKGRQQVKKFEHREGWKKLRVGFRSTMDAEAPCRAIDEPKILL